MFGSVLPVILGLVFIYFVFSTVVGKVNEFVSTRLGWRARDLEKWLQQTLDPPGGEGQDQPLVSTDRFKSSSLITSITKHGARHKLPSYISPRTFSLAILDLMAPGDQQVTSVDQVKSVLAELPDGHPAKAPLLRLAIEAGDDLTVLRAGIEGWFNDSMARVSGWYKRRVQRWLLVYAIVVTVALNVDTVVITRILWGQDAVREAVVAQAGRQGAQDVPAEKRDDAANLKDISSQVAEVSRLGVPIGWAAQHSDDPRHLPSWGWEIPLKLLGLAITVGALSLGAPFWFDLLNKIAKLRSTGDRPSTGPSQPTPTPNQPVVVLQKAEPPS